MKGFVFAVVTIALLAIPLAAWSPEDGAALYKTKCAACHGPAGEGKPAIKGPALKGMSVTPEKIVALITKGGEDKSRTYRAPHTKAITGVTAEQAAAIADFAKTLLK
jgi:mono/diheme cytochrome c family protein